MHSKKIIVALDSNNFTEIEKLVKSLKKDVYAFKIGYQFFFNFGLIGYKKIFSICPKIFLDLKLHDIPNTVKNGLAALNKIKPIFTTIHVSGGDEMMKSSVKNKKFTKILGVSILTSMDSKQTKKIYNQKFSKGHPTSKLKETKKKTNKKGTKISFKPDPEIFGPDNNFNCNKLYDFSKRLGFHKMG